MTTPRPHLAALAALLLAGSVALGACSGDSTGDSSDTPAPTAASSGGSAGDAEPDVEAALGAMGLERKGEALVSAADAEKFEIEGDVLHLYLGDSSKVPAGTECMIVSSVLSDGEKAVVHTEDGSEVAC